MEEALLRDQRTHGARASFNGAFPRAGGRGGGLSQTYPPAARRLPLRPAGDDSVTHPLGSLVSLLISSSVPAAKGTTAL